MTTPALAHAIARADALRRGLGEPTLVTGAEQDALLAELIAERPSWHLDVDPGARTLPGFRTELRDLITRAGELGLTPAALEDLGRERGRPAWRTPPRCCATTSACSTSRPPPPSTPAPAWIREPWCAAPPCSPTPLPAPFGTVVVDDAQDLTAAGIELVAPWPPPERGAGALPRRRRGHLPRRPPRRRRPAAGRARRVARDRARGAHAQQEGLTAAVDSLRGRLPLAGAPAQSRRPRGTERAGLVALRAQDPLDEARLIGSALRDLHHREEVPYDEMAVVCRSGAAVADLADLLSRTGLPVRAPRRPQPLREVPAVADLMTILEIGLAPAGSPLDPRAAGELLRGPFGDADTLRLRRIRRLLLTAHRPRSRTARPPASSCSPAPWSTPRCPASRPPRPGPRRRPRAPCARR